MLSRACLVALPALVLALAHCSGADTTGITPPPDTGNPPSGTPEAGAQDDGSTNSQDDAGIPGPTGVEGRRLLPPEVLSRKAICYSGYRGTESPDSQTYPSEAEIKEDLDLLKRGGWTFLRLFDCSPHAERVLKVIRDNSFDMRVMQGIWIAGAKAQHDKENQDEIDKCVTLAKTYNDIVVALSVGNENLDDWSDVKVAPAELAAYITSVRSRVTQAVTSDDLYAPYLLGQDGATSYADVILVARSVDFLSVHIYPFLDAPYDSWDFKQLGVPKGPARAAAMMNAALEYTKSSLADVRQTMKQNGLDVPIVLGEVGWKSAPTATKENEDEPYMAHPVNQKMYYDAVVDWIYGSKKDATSPSAAFYFEPFDEPWKQDDTGWGLFDDKRSARYVLWDQFPDKKPAGAPNYTSNDAVYYNK
jgi:exo-beta-1,3-glucanase (GH17 family)